MTGSKLTNLSYVLITPAHNEAAFIEATIECMLRQTTPPKRWIIVSDASTDGTDDIVLKYAKDCPWLELVRLEQASARDFGGKVRAFNAGYARISDLEYDIIGNLDADLTFEPDYFEFLMRQFEALPDHGLLGTTYIDVLHGGADEMTRDPRHVPGACQLFRRACFEAIGGYKPLPTGGVDLLAELASRKEGWKTQAFSEKVLHHYRPVGTATRNVYSSRFNYGFRDYYFGGSILWELLRTINQFRRPPYIIGGLCILSGYLWGLLTRQPSPVPDDIRAFRRKEQLDRIRRMLGGG